MKLMTFISLARVTLVRSKCLSRCVFYCFYYLISHNSSSLLLYIEYTKVNILYPENNRGIRVLACRDLPGKEAGKRFDGFIIMMEGSAIDIFGTGEEGAEEPRSDIYHAKVLTKFGNKVLISVAATNGVLSGQFDNEIKAFIGEQCIRDAIETATNEIDEDPDRARNIKHILLDFPPDLGLSSDVLDINEDNEKGDLTMEMAPLVINMPSLNPDPLPIKTVEINGVQTPCVVMVKHACPVVFWRVAINEVGRKLGARSKKTKKKTATERAYEAALQQAQRGVAGMNTG